MRAVTSDRAEADIQAAYDWWTRRRSPAQAARWYDGIYNAIEMLGANPERYPLAVESSRFPFDLRVKLFGLGRRPTHRILFTIRPDSDSVYVLAVRHVAQDAVGLEDV